MTSLWALEDVCSEVVGILWLGTSFNTAKAIKISDRHESRDQILSQLRCSGKVPQPGILYLMYEVTIKASLRAMPYQALG